ncbi:hypothetical protein Cgig2_024555 [Carnegiea gigantea]|uniref:Uncharacterized protein n=1 Tax=Carnegiea gigantea TaxID=171969 RepID=A0A9Q1H079_9CARY|nr:hypothetical protein Cgig2_024555 [Carnegiea gigantea]
MQRYKAGAQTCKEVGKDRDKAVIEVNNFNFLKVGIEHEMYPMELRKRQRSVKNEATPIIDSRSAFEVVDEGTDNSASNPSLSLEAEVSQSNGEVQRMELRSKHVCDIGVSESPRVRRPKKGGAVVMTELRSKRVHDKGGRRERGRGNKGKSGAEKGMVVEKEGEGIGDVVVRHRCTLEAVCTLNSELKEC